MRVRRGASGVIAVLAAAAMLVTSMAAGVTPAAANSYEDPFFLNWPTYVASSPVSEYEATDADDCKKGKVQCVDKVIREMTKRFNALRCDHDSTFAFTYLLTTEEYRRAVEDPYFFSDNAFINHQDAVFARYYFDQFDDWHAGRTEEVSPAWRIAFHAADRQQVTGMGNVFLGMNAHVNRDLPFVLAEIGLVKPDGTSRKPDHDRVNDFLARTNQYLLAEAAKVLDPTLDDGDVPGTSVDNSTAVQALVAWREQAWRNAERLVAAATPEARARVAQEIEQMAALEALTIRESFRYNLTHTLLGTDAKARNAFCGKNFQAR
jgi:hypothetical protein